MFAGRVEISIDFQKPADLDLHCFLKQEISNFSVASVSLLYTELQKKPDTFYLLQTRK